MRLKLAARFVSGVGFPPERQGGAEGTAFMKVSDLTAVDGEVRTSANYVDDTTLSLLRARVVPLGSLLLPKIGAAIAITNRRVTNGIPAAFDNNVLAIVPTQIDTGYLRHWVRGLDLSPYVNPGALPSLNVGAMANLKVPVPDRAMQRTISDYLDRESERIDRAIFAAKELAMVSAEAVDADCERVFVTGITQSTRLGALLSQRPTYGVLVPRLVPTGVLFIRVGDLDSITTGGHDISARIPQAQAHEYRRTSVRADDVLVSVVGSIDKSAIVPRSLEGSNVARAVALLRSSNVSPFLLWAWTRTTAYSEQAKLATNSDTAQPTLNMRDLAGFNVELPVDQAAAERVLRDKHAVRVRVEAGARDLIARLTAYRQSLAHEAVNGDLNSAKSSDQRADERFAAVLEGSRVTEAL